VVEIAHVEPRIGARWIQAAFRNGLGVSANRRTGLLSFFLFCSSTCLYLTHATAHTMTVPGFDLLAAATTACGLGGNQFLSCSQRLLLYGETNVTEYGPSKEKTNRREVFEAKSNFSASDKHSAPQPWSRSPTVRSILPPAPPDCRAPHSFSRDWCSMHDTTRRKTQAEGRALQRPVLRRHGASPPPPTISSITPSILPGHCVQSPSSDTLLLAIKSSPALLALPDKRDRFTAFPLH